jgi:hypothetical protein
MDEGDFVVKGRERHAAELDDAVQRRLVHEVSEDRGVGPGPALPRGGPGNRESRSAGSAAEAESTCRAAAKALEGPDGLARVGGTAWSWADQRRRREQVGGLALELLADGAVGLDATLHTAVGALEVRFNLGADDAVSVQRARVSREDTAQPWFDALLRAARRLAEIDLDILVSHWDRPGSTYGTFSRRVLASIGRRLGLPHFVHFKFSSRQNTPESLTPAPEPQWSAVRNGRQQIKLVAGTLVPGLFSVSRRPPWVSGTVSCGGCP